MEEKIYHKSGRFLSVAVNGKSGGAQTLPLFLNEGTVIGKYGII